MYFIAKLHPRLVETQTDGYKGKWLTKREKQREIKRFYEKNLQIPLNIGHFDCDRFGFVSPLRSNNVNIGRVIDMFNDKNGELVIKALLYNTHPAYKQINQGVYLSGEKWGVSIWLNLMYENGFDSGPTTKCITHVALTTDPYFASEGTYIYHWGLSEAAVDKTIHELYYDEKNSNCYAMPQLIEKLAGTFLLLLRPVIKFS